MYILGNWFTWFVGQKKHLQLISRKKAKTNKNWSHSAYLSLSLPSPISNYFSCSNYWRNEVRPVFLAFSIWWGKTTNDLRFNEQTISDLLLSIIFMNYYHMFWHYYINQLIISYLIKLFIFCRNDVVKLKHRDWKSEFEERRGEKNENQEWI